MFRVFVGTSSCVFLNVYGCSISTGIFGYPLMEATSIALHTVRLWLETGDNKDKVVSNFIFCLIPLRWTALSSQIINLESLMLINH